MVTEPVLQPRSKTVPEGRAPQLPRRLVAEVSGLTNWVIEGLARLRGNGSFTIPAKMAATLKLLVRKSMYCGVQGLQDFGVENELECRAVLAVFCPKLRA